MAKESNSHITVTFSDIYGSTAVTFKVCDKVFRKLRRRSDWLGRPKSDLTGKALADWLRDQECFLDSDDGPAYIRRYNAGHSVEGYYRDGVSHRVNGPATIVRAKDGSATEFHYVHGKQCGAVERDTNGETRPLPGPIALPPFPRP